MVYGLLRSTFPSLLHRRPPRGLHSALEPVRLATRLRQLDNVTVTGVSGFRH
jgi:hypothetical protein